MGLQALHCLPHTYLVDLKIPGNLPMFLPTQHAQMSAADDDPQPSTSSGVTRSETTEPLNEQEYKLLEANLGPNFGGMGER